MQIDFFWQVHVLVSLQKASLLPGRLVDKFSYILDIAKSLKSNTGSGMSMLPVHLLGKEPLEGIPSEFYKVHKTSSLEMGFMQCHPFQTL